MPVQETVVNGNLVPGTSIQILDPPSSSVLISSYLSSFFAAAGAISVVVGFGFLTAQGSQYEGLRIAICIIFAAVWLAPPVINQYQIMMDDKSIYSGRRWWWVSALFTGLGVGFVLLAFPMASWEYAVVGCAANSSTLTDEPQCKGLLAAMIGTVGCAWGLYLAIFVLGNEFSRLGRPLDPSYNHRLEPSSSWKQMAGEIIFAIILVISLVLLIMIGLVSDRIPYFIGGSLAWMPLIWVGAVQLICSQRVTERRPGNQLNWAMGALSSGGLLAFMHLFVALYLAFFSETQPYKIGAAFVNFFLLFLNVLVIILAADELERVPH